MSPVPSFFNQVVPLAPPLPYYVPGVSWLQRVLRAAKLFVRLFLPESPLPFTPIVIPQCLFQRPIDRALLRTAHAQWLQISRSPIGHR